MEQTQLPNDLTNEKIEFVTTRDDSWPLPALGRRVIVTGPPDVVKLVKTGNVSVLDELVGLLQDPARAWAAEVVLASLTRNEENIVNAFANNQNQWRESVGKNAYTRWKEWLAPRAGKLSWDAESHAFEEKGLQP